LLETLSNNTSIVHLDLSNNSFNLKDSQSISNSLYVIFFNFQYIFYKYNKTIYGFHFSKNHGYVDQYGFLIFDNYFNEIFFTSTRINSVKPS